MAPKRGEILTPWAEFTEEGETVRWPLVTSEFSLSRWQDITGQDAQSIPPEPNVVSILVDAEESVFVQIGADNRFYILWEEYL